MRPSTRDVELTRVPTVGESGGNLVNDAHLAAIAIEQRADIVSYDTDFALLPGGRFRRPDELI